MLEFAALIVGEDFRLVLANMTIIKPHFFKDIDTVPKTECFRTSKDHTY